MSTTIGSDKCSVCGAPATIWEYDLAASQSVVVGPVSPIPHCQEHAWHWYGDATIQWPPVPNGLEDRIKHARDAALALYQDDPSQESARFLWLVEREIEKIRNRQTVKA